MRNGLLNEQGVFGQRSEPQSMRDTSAPGSAHAGERGGLRGGGGSTEGEGRANGDEERGFIRRQWVRDWNGRRRWRRHFKPKRLLSWLAVLGALGLILLFSGVFGDAQGNGGHPSDGNGRNEPENDPSHEDPTKDSPMPPHRSTAQCTYRTFSTPKQYEFTSPDEFSLLEFMEDATERAFFNDRITGTIQLSPAPASQKAAIVVWINVALSGSMQVERLRTLRDDEGMQIMFPDVSGDIKSAGTDAGRRWTGGEENCLDFSVGVLVKSGTRLGELDISTANFDVKVEHGVFDRVVDSSGDDDELADEMESVGPAFEHVDSTTITAVRGRVQAAYLSSRKTYIETTSSSISGTYALRDLLAVKSSSGSIKINVDPKNASSEDPEHPADFRASSNSGSIDVGYLTDSIGGDEIPDRDYTTRVSTSSSSIKGSYILGSNAKLDSNSGSIDARILPYFANKASALRTSSGSAQTRLRLLSPYTTTTLPHAPYNPRSDILDHLKSTHKTISGSLHLTYPDEWEGIIDGSSTSGSIRVRGEDVEVLVDEDIGKDIPGYGKNRRVMKHVTARKGYGDSRLNFETTSGSVDVLVGRA